MKKKVLLTACMSIILVALIFGIVEASFSLSNNLGLISYHKELIELFPEHTEYYDWIHNAVLRCVENIASIVLSAVAVLLTIFGFVCLHSEKLKNALNKKLEGKKETLIIKFKE